MSYNLWGHKSLTWLQWLSNRLCSQRESGQTDEGLLPWVSLASHYERRKKVKSLSCVQLFDPVDCSPPGSSIHGILQTRILEWVAISISFSRGSFQPRDQSQVSRTAGRLFTVWSGNPIGRGIQTKGWDSHWGSRSLVVVFLDFHPSSAFPRRGVIFVFSLDQKRNGMMGTSYPQGWIYYNESIMNNRLHSGTRYSHHSLLPGHLSTEHVTQRFWRFLLSFVCRGPPLFARCVISCAWLVPHFSCLPAVTESELSWVSRYSSQDDWHKLLGWGRREDTARNERFTDKPWIFQENGNHPAALLKNLAKINLTYYKYIQEFVIFPLLTWGKALPGSR